jgi:hypothetical protein
MEEVGQTFTVPVISHRVPVINPRVLIQNVENVTVRIVEETRRWQCYTNTRGFYREFNIFMTKYPDFKELMQFIFPRQFPSEPPVSELTSTNKFIGNPTLLELIRSLGNDEMNVNDRHSKLTEIITHCRFDERICHIASLAQNILKESQVVKVEFIAFPGKFAYYEFDGYRKNKYMPIVEGFENLLRPEITSSGEMKSILPDMYTLEQITEINYWINHSMLSIYLMQPEIIRSVITNPFVGNEATWRNIAEMFNNQYEVLHSAAKPIDEELTVYRGSPHFKPYSVRYHSIFATSKDPEVAGKFSKANNSKANNNNYNNKFLKVIKLPIGTRVLDLSVINSEEQEVLVFPKAVGLNMVIERVSARNSYRYRIRNVNEERNRNLPRSRRGRRGGSRRYTRRRR